ncbi:SEC-C motif-containing protein [Natranaerovirga pectinivora]|uniref:SEC-C motif-containing protein n=1 Tax=Natranaerovirga pectinivora TaxID=682400 RepID=A0A4R3MLK6_9FIRM|nr:SEC-C metal-binding domain-containing protein [Natranaerovirga pectinivora]TCT15582.1 SEC-C motif-containing protein [Natranaerovirga pectinivora]
MSLYTEWQDYAGAERSEEEYNEFWEAYFSQEQAVYDNLLQNNISTLEGTLAELAKKYDMDHITFIGFLDGINTSLTEAVDLDSLTEDSALNLTIDFEKLYFNMLDAKASWLFNLESWDTILTEEKRKEIKKEYNKTQTVVKDTKINRNDPCPCGSGKKFKKCCIDN